MTDEPAGSVPGSAGQDGTGAPRRPADRIQAADFASGGIADEMSAGPGLAAGVEDAWQQGLAALSDDELIGVLRAARRLASRAAALEWSAVADLVGRRQAAGEVLGAPRPGEVADAEVAAALTLTRFAAAHLQDVALGVARLPGVMKALTAGRIDPPKATVIAAETTGLSDVAAGAVGAAVIRDAPGQTTGQLRAACRQAVLIADPSAAWRRKEAALKQARVELWHEPSGTAALAGRDLPAAQALAADRHLAAAARWLKGQGVDATVSQLRAQAFVTLLAGQSLHSLLPPPTAPDRPAPAPSASAEPPAPCCSGPPGTGTSSTPHEGGVPGTGAGPVLAGSVNLTLPLATWLGWSESPGLVPGFGPLDAADSRALAAMLARHPATRWCLTLTGPGGEAAGHACARHRPGPPFSGPRSSGHPPPAPAADSRPGTGPGRGTATPSAGPGPGNAGPPAGTGPPGLAAIAAWLSRLHPEPLGTVPCDHTLASPGYHPPRHLQHLARLRNPVCTHPGCRHPAGRCDLDHTIAYEKGGRTCLCNLGPRCRYHHQVKQAAGWTLTQPRPGTFLLVTPSGRTYTTTPPAYPG